MLRTDPPVPPFSQVAVFNDALPDELFARVAADHALGAVGHDAGWWPAGEAPRCLIEEAAQALLPFAERSYYDGWGAHLAPVLVGAEWRTDLARCDEDRQPSFCRSEALWEARGLVRHPYFGSMLYLDGLGGPTVIMNQRPLHELGGAGEVAIGHDPAVVDAGQWRSVEPAPNRYVQFPGWALHGGLASDDPGSRRTLLFNWWCWRPSGLPGGAATLTGE